MSSNLEGVACLLMHSYTGKLLLQKRDDKPKLYPLYWTALGGKVELNELPKEAVIRELYEEVSLSPSLYYWKAYDNHLKIENKSVTVKQHVFVGSIDLSISEIKLNEGEKLGFFKKADLPHLKIGFNFYNLFLSFFSELVLLASNGFTLNYTELTKI
jgi:8-oxo-dGTP diphosphatase